MLSLSSRVVAVGGDGTVYQCAKGLLLTAARDAGIDINKSDSRLVKSAVRLGHIPAGNSIEMGHHLPYLYNHCAFPMVPTMVRPAQAVALSHICAPEVSNGATGKIIRQSATSQYAELLKKMLNKSQMLNSCEQLVKTQSLS